MHHGWSAAIAAEAPSASAAANAVGRRPRRLTLWGSRRPQRIAEPDLSVRPVAARRGRLRTRRGRVLGAEADVAASGGHALVARREVAAPRADLVGDDETPRIVLGAAGRGTGRQRARRDDEREGELSADCAHGAGSRRLLPAVNTMAGAVIQRSERECLRTFQ